MIPAIETHIMGFIIKEIGNNMKKAQKKHIAYTG